MHAVAARSRRGRGSRGLNFGWCRGTPGEAERGRRVRLDDGAAVRVAARAGLEGLLFEFDHDALSAPLLLSDRAQHLRPRAAGASKGALVARCELVRVGVGFKSSRVSTTRTRLRLSLGCSKRHER